MKLKTKNRGKKLRTRKQSKQRNYNKKTIKNKIRRSIFLLHQRFSPLIFNSFRQANYQVMRPIIFHTRLGQNRKDSADISAKVIYMTFSVCHFKVIMEIGFRYKIGNMEIMKGIAWYTSWPRRQHNRWRVKIHRN